MELEKGICRLSAIPVRADASDKSEMVTQLLFGEHYETIETNVQGQWLKVRNHFDGYEGWIAANQHHAIPDEYYEQINSSDYKVSLDICSSILYKKNYISIVMGSVLPISTNELFKMEEQLAFNGESKSLSQKWSYDQLHETALKYHNAPYLWGGKTPFGIDCSGFTQMVFRICGYSLKRDASQQMNQGTRVDRPDQAMPGDLLFFRNAVSGTAHVGILLEEEKIIHASGRVRTDLFTEDGLFNEEYNRLTHLLTGIRRILKI